ncbi:unnamed protein product [Brassica napus]|uniref:(rape) hypothetical protein n=1 Tax=Brassica napus TaxID=3708 RepID=A0A816YG76_BRANA|nr:unnamed protein product [Brassica napus]
MVGTALSKCITHGKYNTNRDISAMRKQGVRYSL